MHLKKVRTYFTENLGSFLPVIEVEVGVWRTTAGADYMSRNRRRASSQLDLSKRLTVQIFVLNQKLLVVFLAEVFFLNFGGSVSGGSGSTMKFL